MALGANVGSTVFGQSQTLSNALIQARLTGRAVSIGNSGLIAYPNGTTGTPSAGTAPQGYAGVQGAAGTQSGSAVTAPASSAPSAATPAVDDYGRTIPTVNVYAPPQQTQQTQAPLNQANPNTTYVSPNTPQPTGAAPVVGQTGTQSGQPVHATYNMPPAPDTATAARTYRAAHGLSTQDDTDALNAESLAAAQAGRTSFDRTLAAQYGQPQAAGVYGPRTDVVNALTTPPATAQTRQQAAQQQANALLQQGTY